MGFKNMFSKLQLYVYLLVIFLIGLWVWKFFSKTDVAILDNAATVTTPFNEPRQENSVKDTGEGVVDATPEDVAAIQEQLDRDRRQQKQTKDLKTQLEQTNLELEQEKALSEINKLKKENAGAFNEPAIDGQKNMPEIKVDYIGGSSIKKEAILSIGNASYQVKEKSNPTGNIQVVSISDSGVTLHFSSPEELTKTIDYKPE